MQERRFLLADDANLSPEKPRPPTDYSRQGRKKEKSEVIGSERQTLAKKNKKKPNKKGRHGNKAGKKSR